jgi:hypothetical protein
MPHNKTIPNACTSHKPIKKSYIEQQEWAEQKMKQGEQQKQCPKCLRWYFDEEM